MWSHDSFLLESGEEELTEEEKKEAFAELEKESPPPSQASQAVRKRKASKGVADARRGAVAEKIARIDVPKSRGVFTQWNITALPFIHKYRGRKAEKRAMDKKKSDELTTNSEKVHITIVFDSKDFDLQKNKLASPIDNTLKVLIATFQKLSDKKIPHEQLGIQALVFGAEGAVPTLWDVPHTMRLETMMQMQLLSNDGIMYLRLRHDV